MSTPFLVQLSLLRTPETTSGYYSAYLCCPSMSRIRKYEGGSIHLPLDPERELPGMQMTLGEFRNRFLQGKGDATNDGQRFGYWLYTCLFGENSPLRSLWEEARREHEVVNEALEEQNKPVRPLRFELVLPQPSNDTPGSERLEELPFELLADETSPLFKRPGWTLVRCYSEHLAKTYEIPRGARALLAWANPEDSAPIAPDVLERHRRALELHGRKLSWQVAAPCERATRRTLSETLRTAQPAVLSLVAHGEAGGGALILHSTQGPKRSEALEPMTLLASAERVTSRLPCCGPAMVHSGAAPEVHWPRGCSTPSMATWPRSYPLTPR